MESAEAKINYVVLTRIVKIEELFESKYIRGYGASAEFEQVSRGWFVHFEGSHEMLNFGPYRPDLSVGDPIKITFERIEP